MEKLQHIFGFGKKERLTLSKSNWKIFDLDGNEVISGVTDSNNSRINTEVLAPGTYNLEFANSSEVSHIKIVKASH